jgi:excisionase family DNA binding protein
VAKQISIADKTYGYDERVDSHVASQIIGLSPRTIRDMATKRELPIYKVGSRAIRYRVSDLLEWVEGRKILVKKID